MNLPRRSGAATLAAGPIRPAAVAGSFYPRDPESLRDLVLDDVRDAHFRHPAPSSLRRPTGLLVPHAGLMYSGLVAASAWQTLLEDARRPGPPTTVVLLGTNHAAVWLDGIGCWDAGAWRTPLGEVAVDDELARAVVGLGQPFGVDREAHTDEHSIEVQLPFLQVLAPGAAIVPLTVSAGVGPAARDAGDRLGALLAARRAAGARIVLVISTDMAHYPPHRRAVVVTDALRPALLALDASALAAQESSLRSQGLPGLMCGMCGIEPAVVGLAALRAMGAGYGIPLAAATSAEVGGPPERTVGYCAVAYP